MASPNAPVVFDSTVESLFFRALKGRVTSVLKEKLRAVGLDLDQKLRPTYPREQWLRVLEITTRELYPTLPPAERYFKLGGAAIEGFTTTLIGKTFLSIGRLLGPRRGIARLPQGFEAMNNFMIAKLTELAPTRFHVWLSDTCGQPTYILGALWATMNINALKNLEVRIEKIEGDSVTYEISWDE